MLEKVELCTLQVKDKERETYDLLSAFQFSTSLRCGKTLCGKWEVWEANFNNTQISFQPRVHFIDSPSFVLYMSSCSLPKDEVSNCRRLPFQCPCNHMGMALSGFSKVVLDK